MASIGQTIAGPRYYETDEVTPLSHWTTRQNLTTHQWFDRQKIYLDSLESQLRGLVKAIDFVTKHRAGMFSHP